MESSKGSMTTVMLDKNFKGQTVGRIVTELEKKQGELEDLKIQLESEWHALELAIKNRKRFHIIEERLKRVRLTSARLDQKLFDVELSEETNK